MKKAFAIFISAAVLLSCAGCSDSSGQSSYDTSETTSESTEAASAEPQSEDISEEVQMNETEDTESTEPSAETSEPAEIAPPADTELPESVTYPSPEDGHMFIDFTYIENVQGVPESELHPYVCERAVYELSEQEEYISACEDVMALEGADISEYLDENGAIVPKLYMAVHGDFNGDGGDDYFVLLTSPCESSFTDSVSELYWLLWVSDNGGANYLDVFRDSVTEISVLDYGICQQLIVCNNGTFGAGCASGIYGIRDGKAVCHYSFRGDFTKVACFINASGWQGSGDFMYYDTVAEEYRCILPDKVIPFAELLEMDKTGSLDDLKADWDGAAVYPVGQLMCGKFWCISFGPMHHGGEPYLYENGGFVYCYERYPVRASEEEQWGGRSYVSGGIDYDEAVATMLTPEAADKRRIEMNTPALSEGQMFVDYDYIKDIKGTEDISAYSLWVDKAVEALRKHEDYLAFNEMLKAEDMSEFKFRYGDMDIADYLDENGDIKPMFNTAYIADYDNDGRDEGFFLLDIPYNTEYSMNEWIIRSYLVYAGDNNTDSEVLTDYAYGTIHECSMLDYGLCKQLIFCSSGTMGADAHSEVFGVTDGKPMELYGLRGGFCKVDCFLAANGWQGMGDFMYYDTVEHIYKPVPSSKLSAREVLAMDSTGVFTDVYQRSAPLPWFMLVGNKYYCLWWGSYADKAYLYENGAFVQCNDSQYIRYSSLLIEGGNSFSADRAIASMLTPEEAGKRESEMLKHFELTEISPNNIFIDFELIYDYHGETDPQKCTELIGIAEQALFSSEMYANASAALTPDKKEIITNGKEIDTSLFFDDSGKLIPVFLELFSEDFDGNGITEHYAVLQLPIKPYDSGTSYYVRDILIYISDSGKAEIVTFYNNFYAKLIDYGAFKQLIAGGSGLGVETGEEIYGLIYERPTKLVGFRGSYYKWECFLTGYGWQASGGMMYYDTSAQEYRTIAGDLLDTDEVYGMDSTGLLPERETSSVKEITLVGGKYYVIWNGWMDEGKAFTYENGAFTPVPDGCYVRLPGYITDSAVKIDDINAVIASMLSPEEALKQKRAERLPSEGHIFVDFSYITDYKGTTDITECGKWYSMALNFLKLGEDYILFNELLKNEDLTSVKYYETVFAPDITDYLDENGNIQPILSGAYIDDYDRNGQDECFLLLDIPYYVEISDYWITRSYLYYGNGKGIKYLNDFSNIWEISMLDYGLCRQFIIRAYGTMGADEGAQLYGVVDGEVVRHYSFRGGFTKVDCFINASGWMGFGDFMYYDTVRQQYRAVASEHIPTPTILEMDSSGAFAEYYDDYENDPASLPWFMLVGGKYYCLWLGPSDMGAPYLYENGCFVPCEDNVRVSAGLPYVELDYDSAVFSMLSPAEAANCT